MKQYFAYILIALTISSTQLEMFAQSPPRWVNLTGYPQTNSRKDDIFFINPSTGWVITNVGYVHKTTDGGISWQQQLFAPSTWLRCIGFVNESTGYIGIYDTTYGNTSMLKTTNGGLNWLPNQSLPIPKPRGLCGISVIKNTQIIYACGRIDGPAILIKSTNAGLNWVNIDVTTYASRLVDCYFTSPDSGFIVGGLGTPYSSTRAVLLFTSDGGNSWTYRVNSPRTSEAFWKINFSSSLNGEASLNISDDSLFFYKSTDGGINWQRLGYSLPSGTYFTQGIGFINANTGWLGGFGGNYTYETNDRGNTWHTNNFGRDINRIRFLNDTIGYAGGTGVYKYTTEQSIGIIGNSNEVPTGFNLNQNFPNPFNPSTIIKYDVSVGAFIQLNIYNLTGQKIKNLFIGFQSEGTYTCIWDGTDEEGNNMASGFYFYKLESEKYSETKKMVLIK